MSKKYVVTEADRKRYERYVVGNEEAIMAAARNGADQLGICKIMGCGRLQALNILAGVIGVFGAFKIGRLTKVI